MEECEAASFVPGQQLSNHLLPCMHSSPCYMVTVCNQDQDQDQATMARATSVVTVCLHSNIVVEAVPVGRRTSALGGGGEEIQSLEWEKMSCIKQASIHFARTHALA